MKTEASMEATEAEIIAECCEELEMVTRGTRDLRKGVGRPCATTTVTPVAGSISKSVPKCTAGKVFDGEDRVAALRDFSRCITEGRKTHLEPSASISSPRLFLLPATNEKGLFRNLRFCIDAGSKCLCYFQVHKHKLVLININDFKAAFGTLL